MKKFLTITSRSLFVLVLLFCIFKSFTILADATIFQITKIEVKEKSEGVVVNDVSLSNGSLNNDIIFSAKDDFVKYNVTIKNNTSSDYTIKTITDNNESPYLEYTYDNIANTKVEGKSELTFELQIKYVNEASGLYISNEPVSLTLTYEKDDGSTSTEVITDNTTPASDLSEESFENEIENPNTGDSINLYIILGLISLAGLGFTFVNKKSYFKTLMFIGLFSILAIPFGAKADSEKFVITFNTNKIQNTSSDLISGPEFNLLIHKLSLGLDNLSIEYFVDGSDEFYNFYNVVNNDYTDQDNEYWIWNEDILDVERATDEEYEAIKDSLTEENIISTSESNNPAYMWFDDSTGTIYYYTPAKVLVMNEDSSLMFLAFPRLHELDLSTFDTLNVTDMHWMFAGLGELQLLNLGLNFDVSKVTNMSYMFYYLPNLQELNLGSKFDTSKVTNMSGMFASSGLVELDLGSKFETSNVTNMSGMFFESYSLSTLNLGSKFDTSKVTNMSIMFASSGLEELDLGSKFDTSNVTNMSYMFADNHVLETIYVSSDFDLLSLVDYNGMFNNAYSLIGENGTSYEDEGVDDSEYARIDDPEHGKPGYFTLGEYDDKVTYSQLISGPEFNLLMHKLSSGNDDLSISKKESPDYYYVFDDSHQIYWDNDINYIERASKRQYNAVKSTLTEKNIISIEDSDKLAYMWYDNDEKTIYYYSSAKKLIMNENSSLMFALLPTLYELHLDKNFDTSQVTNMSFMFGGDVQLEYFDLGENFDTSNVTNMSSMFIDLSRVPELLLGDRFDTSNVTDMSGMFASTDFEIGWALTNLDLGKKFDTSNVTNMSAMFMNMNQLQELNLGDKFDTSKVTDMSAMFAGMNKLTKIYTANDFDLSSLVDEYSDDSMFAGDYLLIGGNGTTYDSNYTNSLYARADYPSLNKPGYFTLSPDAKSTSNLISGPEFNIRMNELYTGLDNLSIKYYEDSNYGGSSYYYVADENDNSIQSTLNVNGIPIMRASGTQYIGVKDTLTARNVVSTANSTIPTYMWYDDNLDIVYYYSDAKILVMNEDSSFMFSGTSFYNNPGLDFSEFDTSNVTNMSYMFSYISGLNTLDLGDNFDTSNVTNMAGMFADSGCIEELNLGNKFDTSKVTDMSYMFHIMYYDSDALLTSINLGNKFDTSKVTDMSWMFYNMHNLEELNLGKKFNTSNVTDMSGMFAGINGIEGLNLGNNFDTSKVTNMSSMFASSGLVELDLGSKFDTSNVTNMSGMFSGSYWLSTLNLGNNFDTSKVTDMSDMFASSGLVELNLGNKFDTSNVTNMRQLFWGCSYINELTLGSKFNTSKVTNMMGMFDGMANLTTLDLGNHFDTSNVTDMSGMFGYDNNLEVIYTSLDFDLSSLKAEYSDLYMFSNDTNLVGGSGTEYDPNHTGSEYARIDDPEHDRPGYFTRRSN